MDVKYIYPKQGRYVDINDVQYHWYTRNVVCRFEYELDRPYCFVCYIAECETVDRFPDGYALLPALWSIPCKALLPITKRGAPMSTQNPKLWFVSAVNACWLT